MVEQFEVDNPFLEGANSFYVLQDAGEVALVDTGVSTDRARRTVEEKLATVDVAVEDVDQVFLTHWHTDHAGLAGDVQARSDATVWVHEADAGLAGMDEETWREMVAAYGAEFEEWGMSPAEQSTSLDWVDTRDDYWGRPASVTTFEAGATFAVGGLELRAVHLPGHTLGSVGYAFDGETGKEVFSGDTLLPGYTPNIGGGEYREMDTQLEQFLTSQQRIADTDYVRAWPGHRGTISEPSERARTIVRHHRDRLARLLEILRTADPGTLRETARHLFGSLDDLHIFIGCAETAMHLEYLRLHDLVTRTANGYEPVPGVSQRLDELFGRYLA